MTLQYAVTTRKVHPLIPKYLVTQHLHITAHSGNHIKPSNSYITISHLMITDKLMLYMYIFF